MDSTTRSLQIGVGREEWVIHIAKLKYIQNYMHMQLNMKTQMIGTKCSNSSNNIPINQGSKK